MRAAYALPVVVVYAVERFASNPTFAPSRQVHEEDIPDLGVSGACISVIGALGQSRGMLIFPSLGAFEAFLEAA